MEKAATLVMLQPLLLRESQLRGYMHVAALDAITAFAVPNPNCSSQKQSVFSGLVTPSGRPEEQINQPTSEWQVLFRQSYQLSTQNKPNSGVIACQRKI
jgi:hypothetical protein